ncbi:HK97 family phage prohead protease [Neisseria musculi]|uniref:Phage prohead protease HK97 family n=1 Tax=Neisseria musculi TaxID=1815583 RepID=A0A7H1MEA4_9NEIS|nr:HK97 family phage prohead protease [Neisseria musculi]QNT59969.1 phage prohead protease, HK97 family [Neisseria musculi]
MKTKHLEIALEIKSVDENGTFTGYGSVFHNEDSYGDIVRPGAFKKSLEKWAAKGRLPPMLWQHWRGDPIGVFTKMQEDDHGLYVEGRLLIDDIPQARAAYALLKEKALGGMSIGYREITTRQNEDGTQDLLELDLWEVSIVTFPANEAATVDSVKADFSDGLPTLPEFEKFLRDAGFSKAQATAIASHGLRQLLRDAEDPEAKDIESALNILKGIKQ